MTPHEKYIRKCLDEAIFNAAHGDEPVCGSMTLTEILCFVLGWQGGTIHLVSKELGVPTEVIMEADYPTMGWLCRLAQVVAHRKLPNPLGFGDDSRESYALMDGSNKP